MREGHVSLLSSVPNYIPPLSFLSLVRCRQVGGGGNDGGGSRTYVASIKANGNAGPLLDFLGHPRGVVDGRWSRSKCLRESGRGCVRSLGRILQNEPSSNQCAVAVEVLRHEPQLSQAHAPSWLGACFAFSKLAQPSHLSFLDLYTTT